MILIADAGGTKTDWRLLKNEAIDQFKTSGFNPHTHDLNVFLENVSLTFTTLRTEVSKVHFYGASIYPENTSFKSALQNVFPQAEIFLNIDLLGSCRALSANDPGFVGILGTGSAGCFYNGEKITIHVPSLGHSIGDEGSGATLGRSLLRLGLRKQLDVELQKLFDDRYHLSKEDAYAEVYNGDQPNAYLASFAEFLSDHRAHPQIHGIVTEEFEKYFLSYFGSMKDRQKHQYHFTGSIAFHFNEFLREVGTKLDVSIGRIVQAPISGLALYHQAHE